MQVSARREGEHGEILLNKINSRAIEDQQIKEEILHIVSLGG